MQPVIILNNTVRVGKIPVCLFFFKLLRCGWSRNPTLFRLASTRVQVSLPCSLHCTEAFERNQLLGGIYDILDTFEM